VEKVRIRRMKRRRVMSVYRSFLWRRAKSSGTGSV